MVYLFIDFINPWLIKQFTKPSFFVAQYSFEKVLEQYKKKSWGLYHDVTDFIFLFISVLCIMIRFLEVFSGETRTPVLNFLFLTSLPFLVYYIACWTKKKLVVFIHSSLPKKLHREAQVREYYNNQVRLHQQNNEGLVTVKIHPAIQDWDKLGAKEFCFKYFNKNGPGFVSFFSDRVVEDQRVNMDFIFYALSIPKASELSVDALRKILLGYQKLSLSEPLNLESAFINYSCRDIEVLFSNPYNRNLLFSLEKKSNLPVAKDLYDLRDKIKEMAIPLALKNLNGKEIDGLKFKVLKMRYEYDETSVEFNNCIHKYWDRGEVIVTVHDQKSRPIACVSVCKKEIFDIKSVSNSDCYEEGLIRQILMKENIV